MREWCRCYLLAPHGMGHPLGYCVSLLSSPMLLASSWSGHCPSCNLKIPLNMLQSLAMHYTSPCNSVAASIPLYWQRKTNHLLCHCCMVWCCCSHLMPCLEDFMAASLACLEVPALTERNMPSANNAIWSLGELMVKIATVVSSSQAALSTVRPLEFSGRLTPETFSLIVTVGRTDFGTNLKW